MLTTKHLGLLSIAWLLATSPASAAGEADVLTTQITEEGSSISWGHAVGVIDKPIDEVLPVVLDYANYVHFMPHFTKSRVLSQRGHRAMVYMEVSVASGTLTLWGQIKLSERAAEGETRIVEARLVDGNMNAFSATWQLTPVDDDAHTSVDFRIYVDPNIPLPSAVFSRENERAAGNTVRALRTRVIERSRRS
ncbi:MAG: SRPBCC family protein [Myxococcales bacterium]|jgi:ribosome-associated toxin RatA of RatAB toxin-antitoxin module